MSVLRIENLALVHLSDLSLQVNGGEIVVVTGESGIGKSLLLRAIADIIPHQGDCYLDDVACNQVQPSAWRRQVAMLPAESQWWRDKVGEHFQRRDNELFTQFKLPAESFEWDVSRCSTGEKQRLALARMLELQPKVLLLDEPTASLDDENRRLVESVIKDYARQQQAAVIWISHDLEQVNRIASRHFVLSRAGLQEQNP